MTASTLQQGWNVLWGQGEANWAWGLLLAVGHSHRRLSGVRLFHQLPLCTPVSPPLVCADMTDRKFGYVFGSRVGMGRGWGGGEGVGGCLMLAGRYQLRRLPGLKLLHSCPFAMHQQFWMKRGGGSVWGIVVVRGRGCVCVCVCNWTFSPMRNSIRCCVLAAKVPPT